MLLLREKTLKQHAKLTRRTMGCVVKLNTDFIGQNFVYQKHDPLSKKKKQ